MIEPGHALDHDLAHDFAKLGSLRDASYPKSIGVAKHLANREKHFEFSVAVPLLNLGALPWIGTEQVGLRMKFFDVTANRQLAPTQAARQLGFWSGSPPFDAHHWR